MEGTEGSPSVYGSGHNHLWRRSRERDSHAGLCGAPAGHLHPFFEPPGGDPIECGRHSLEPVVLDDGQVFSPKRPSAIHIAELWRRTTQIPIEATDALGRLAGH
jgi:hypothetical protein